MKTIKTQAIIEGIRAKKDRSISMNISTPELSPSEKALFFELQGLNLQLIIDPIDYDRAEDYKVDKDLDEKSPSQRMRNVLFILWNQQSDKEKQEQDFNDFYRFRMEQIINKLKGEINELPY